MYSHIILFKIQKINNIAENFYYLIYIFKLKKKYIIIFVYK